jgi:predicted aminopeptidase
MVPPRDRLRFIRELRAFGERTLGLRFDGSFARFVPRNPTANWIYVVHPDRLKSALAGNETFRFSWKIAQVRRWDRYQRRRGRDTYVYRAEAHGGARCPVTPSLLAAPRARQGYVVLHEAWHSTLRLEGVRLPYALEEATGRVVGVMGAVLFARTRGDRELLRETLAQARDWGALASFVNRTYRRLERAYRAPGDRRDLLSRRRRHFRAIREEARILRARTISAWEREELTRPMNNALFFRYYDYTRFYPLALRVYRRVDSLPRAMRIFRRAGETGAPDALRRFLRRGPGRSPQGMAVK